MCGLRLTAVGATSDGLQDLTGVLWHNKTDRLNHLLKKSRKGVMQ
jgi:hypothetical protein